MKVDETTTEGMREFGDLERRLAEAEADRLDSLARLAGAVAHDYNNLLTVINGYGELALGQLDPGDPLHESVREIKTAGERAIALTQQLLAFSRRQALSPEPLDLNAVLAEMEPALRRQAGQGIELVIVRGARLGLVEADPGKLRVAIGNLVANAREAMPAGGRMVLETADVEIDVESARLHPSTAPGRYVMIAVSDTGAGIPQAQIRRLFEPFSTTKRGKGLGFGLSTAHGIVRQSGGDIWVHSEPGHGSCFKVYLPRMAEDGVRPDHRRPSASVSEGPAAPDAPDTTPARPARRVLVVDDEPEIRRLLRQFLERAGYVVIEAPDGRQAVAKVERGGIALMLTDLVMPEKEGIETIREMRLHYPEVKIVAMSGAFAGRFLKTAEMLGAHATLPKPVRAETLIRTVGELLGQS